MIVTKMDMLEAQIRRQLDSGEKLFYQSLEEGDIEMAERYSDSNIILRDVLSMIHDLNSMPFKRLVENAKITKVIMDGYSKEYKKSLE